MSKPDGYLSALSNGVAKARRRQKVLALATLAAGRTDFVSGQKLEPIYLRETTFVKAPPRQILPND